MMLVPRRAIDTTRICCSLAQLSSYRVARIHFELGKIPQRTPSDALLLERPSTDRAVGACVHCRAKRAFDAMTRASTPGPKARPSGGTRDATSTPSAAPSRPASAPRIKQDVGRFFLCPLVSILSGWALALRKDIVLRYIPDVHALAFPLPSWTWSWLWCLARAPYTTVEAVPRMTSSALQALDIGVLYGRMQVAHEAARMLVLQSASDLLNQSVEVEEMYGVRYQLALTFFIVVKLVWFGAIVGIMISALPVMWLFIENFWNLLGHMANALSWLVQNVMEVLCSLYEALVENVFIPLAKTIEWIFDTVLPAIFASLHEWGCLEALLHALAFWVRTQAARMETGWSMYVAVFGLLLSGVAWVVSADLHGILDSTLEDLKSLLFALVAALIAPHAYLQKSALLGYATVTAAFLSLQFSNFALPLCYSLGFKKEKESHKAWVCTGFIVLAFQLISAVGVNQSWLVPFSSAASILGGISHYAALFYMSNEYHPLDGCSSMEKEDIYFTANFTLLGSLLLSQAYGRFFGVQSLANTSTSFAFLWLMDKIRECAKKNDMNEWLRVFGGSLATYYTALWLHANADFVVAMLQ
eukprot:TRINITY_DN90586_c0_g1_i1.p1 TRINITY_DN90586_c0_g1~~TRINITY_DN90586_c0_g1_i1.p1  ORF type:complete len:586 (-),score=73.43 TRINITY_DN90586_c0_g1_i1:315-2072(-)